MKILSFVTDIEHPIGKPLKSVIELARNSDILIHEAHFSPEDLPKHSGWGHSSWQEAIKVTEAANVKETFLFHHDPSHDDAKMDAIAEEAAKVRSGVRPAVEGEEIEL